MNDLAVDLGSDASDVVRNIAGVFGRQVLERTGVAVRETGSERIVFGTDLPWFNHHYYIGSVLGAGITDDDRHNILHRNAEKLLAPFLNDHAHNSSQP